jgi:hypothetical protein
LGHTATGPVATEHDQRERSEAGGALGVTGTALGAFADASRALAEGSSLHEALHRLVGAAAEATRANVAIARVVDAADATLKARAVWASSAAVAAELEGSRFPAAELPRDEVVDVAELPGAVRRASRGRGRCGEPGARPAASGLAPAALPA